MLKKLISLFVLIVFILFEFCELYSYALTPYEGNVENPVLQEVTTDSITLVPIEGYEYSKDGMIWQDSNVFNNLTIGTTYEMYQRVKATDEVDKSHKSSVLEVTTKKNENHVTPNVPSLSRRTDSSITLVSYQGYEYSIDGEMWQDSNTFNNLTSNTSYTFYQRIKETSDTYASIISIPASFYTLKKENSEEPAEIQVEEVTPTSITLVAVDGYEYSINGTNFQDNNIFESLTPNTDYTLYQRMKETDEYEAGSISNKTIKTTKYTNTNSVDAPILESYTAKDVILKKIDILEYSKDQENWQDSNIFTDLSPETEYTFYQRIKATDDTYASEISEGLKIKTKKENTNIPIKPEVENVIENVITLKRVEGYEYSLDGLNFQKSNVFEKLRPLKEYEFTQRLESTNEYGYSINSEKITIKTLQIVSEYAIIDNYIPIYAEEDFNYTNNTTEEYNYILMKDITFQGKHEISFYGNFEGNGHTIISNQKFVKNNYGIINNLTIEINSDHKGGIILDNNYGTIENCISKAINNAKSTNGMIIYNESSGIIKNCKNEVNIEKTDGTGVGGIAYYSYGLIDSCSNTGNIVASSGGGIVGSNSRGVVCNCYNIGKITCTGTGIGGICGYQYWGTIEKCYNMGIISGKRNCGGIVGNNSYSSVENCYSAGITCSNEYDESYLGYFGIGGLVGENGNDSTTNNCYALRLGIRDYMYGYRYPCKLLLFNSSGKTFFRTS